MAAIPSRGEGVHSRATSPAANNELLEYIKKSNITIKLLQDELHTTTQFAIRLSQKYEARRGEARREKDQLDEQLSLATERNNKHLHQLQLLSTFIKQHCKHQRVPEAVAAAVSEHTTAEYVSSQPADQQQHASAAVAPAAAEIAATLYGHQDTVHKSPRVTLGGVPAVATAGIAAVVAAPAPVQVSAGDVGSAASTAPAVAAAALQPASASQSPPSAVIPAADAVRTSQMQQTAATSSKSQDKLSSVLKSCHAGQPAASESESGCLYGATKDNGCVPAVLSCKGIASLEEEQAVAERLTQPRTCIPQQQQYACKAQQQGAISSGCRGSQDTSSCEPLAAGSSSSTAASSTATTGVCSRSAGNIHKASPAGAAVDAGLPVQCTMRSEAAGACSDSQEQPAAGCLHRRAAVVADSCSSGSGQSSSSSSSRLHNVEGLDGDGSDSSVSASRPSKHNRAQGLASAAAFAAQSTHNHCNSASHSTLQLPTSLFPDSSSADASSEDGEGKSDEEDHDSRVQSMNNSKLGSSSHLQKGLQQECAAAGSINLQCGQGSSFSMVNSPTGGQLSRPQSLQQSASTCNTIRATAGSSTATSSGEAAPAVALWQQASVKSSSSFHLAPPGSGRSSYSSMYSACSRSTRASQGSLAATYSLLEPENFALLLEQTSSGLSQCILADESGAGMRCDQQHQGAFSGGWLGAEGPAADSSCDAASANSRRSSGAAATVSSTAATTAILATAKGSARSDELPSGCSSGFLTARSRSSAAEAARSSDSLAAGGACDSFVSDGGSIFGFVGDTLSSLQVAVASAGTVRAAAAAVVGTVPGCTWAAREGPVGSRSDWLHAAAAAGQQEPFVVMQDSRIVQQQSPRDKGDAYSTAGSAGFSFTAVAGGSDSDSENSAAAAGARQVIAWGGKLPALSRCLASSAESAPLDDGRQQVQGPPVRECEGSCTRFGGGQADSALVCRAQYVPESSIGVPDRGGCVFSIAEGCRTFNSAADECGQHLPPSSTAGRDSRVGTLDRGVRRSNLGKSPAVADAALSPLEPASACTPAKGQVSTCEVPLQFAACAAGPGHSFANACDARPQRPTPGVPLKRQQQQLQAANLGECAQRLQGVSSVGSRCDSGSESDGQCSDELLPSGSAGGSCPQTPGDEQSDQQTMDADESEDGKRQVGRNLVDMVMSDHHRGFNNDSNSTDDSEANNSSDCSDSSSWTEATDDSCEQE